MCHLSKFLPRTMRIRGTIQLRTFLPKWRILDWYFAIIGRFSTKRNDRSSKWVRQIFFTSRPSHQIITWNLSANFHLDLIAKIQQRCFFLCRHTFFSGNPICFWSVWCRRTMIPEKIFTDFAEFWRNCQCKMTFGFLSGFEELLQASLGFLWSFVFARIRLDPLSS